MPWTDVSRLVAGGIAVAAVLASPAMAAGEPSTRLVSCRDGSCLLVTGSRAEAGSRVRINGRPVAVEGGRRWRVLLPMTAVRAWSAPHARTITVSSTGKTAEADLPIGLLGHAADLSVLTISMK